MGIVACVVTTGWGTDLDVKITPAGANDLAKCLEDGVIIIFTLLFCSLLLLRNVDTKEDMNKWGLFSFDPFLLSQECHLLLLWSQ